MKFSTNERICRIDKMVESRLWIFVSVLFFVSVVLRLSLVLVSGIQDMGHIASSAEPVRVAISILQKGEFADAYGEGVGLTAHVLPIHPLTIAALLKIFGMGKAGALSIHLLGIVTASIGIALLPAITVFWRLGAITGLAASLFCTFLPVNFWVQTSGLFDQPITFMLFAFISCYLGKIWFDAYFSRAQSAFLGALLGVGLLINSATIPIFMILSFLGIWLAPISKMHAIKFISTTVVLALLISSPWAIRNYFAFDKLIWTRTNFGLELYLSNHDGAYPSAELNMEKGDFYQTHPMTSNSEKSKVKTLGEVKYNIEKKTAAKQWITNNTSKFLALSLKRIELFWFPQMSRWWQSVAESLVSIVCILGVIILLRHRRYQALYFSALILGYSAIFLIIEVSPRYRFPVEPFMVLLGCGGHAFSDSRLS